MRLETSASESGEKDVNECMLAGKMCLTVCGEENCALMVLIFINEERGKVIKFNYYLFLNRWSTLNLKKNCMKTCQLHIMQFFQFSF